MAEINLEPGLSIHYQDLNPDGEPGVLLLHGLGTTADAWQLQFPALLNAGFRVIAPDMRGFGKSSYPGGSNQPGVMAQDMFQLMQALSMESFHLVGISLGGTVALELVLSAPEMVKSLVITNSFAKLRPWKFSLWLFYGMRLFLVHMIGIETQADYVAKRLFPSPEQTMFREAFREQISQANPHGYRSVMRSLAYFDVTSEVKKIESPTLVITGDEDNVVPPAVQAQLAAAIPGAQHITMTGAGHAVIVEKPEEYNQVLLDFLQVQSQ